MACSRFCWVFIFATALCAACQAPAPKQAPEPIAPPAPTFSRYAQVDTVTYTFYSEQGHHVLKNRRNGQRYEIAQSQLEPLVQDGLEPQFEVRYGPLVMAAPAGKGLLCLYLSSYETADGGSLALAEGYDVFLLLDTLRGRVLPGTLRFGLTRGRHKSMGYFEATYTHFYLGGFSDDGVCLIGTRKEEVHVDFDNEMLSPKGGPYHDIGPLQWYRFDGTAWAYDPNLDRLFPTGKNAGEWPPTTPMTSIDMALGIYRGRRF